MRVNFAPHCDRRVPHLRVVSCGLAFLFGTKFPPQSATRRSRILRVSSPQIAIKSSSFTVSKLRRGFSCAPKIRSLLCVFSKTHITGAFCTKIQRAEFLICVKQTADSAPSFGTKIPPFSAFLGLLPTDDRQFFNTCTAGAP